MVSQSKPITLESTDLDSASSFNTQIHSQNTRTTSSTSTKTSAFNEASTHPLTTRGNLVCWLGKEVLLAKAGVCSNQQQQGHQEEQEGGHGQAFQSRQASAILTHTGVVAMSCLRSPEASTSVHVLWCCAARQVAHSAAGRSKCRYLQNLPGWHRLAAVAPPHEASPDMSGRRPCRAHSQTDQSRDMLTKFTAFPALDKATLGSTFKRFDDHLGVELKGRLECGRVWVLTHVCRAAGTGGQLS